MPKFNFSSAYEEAEKKHGLGGGTFKIKEGQNRIRIVSECVPHSSVYQGKITFKFLCQVIDRKDGEIKLFFMPVKIFKAIEALQMSEDFTFDEVPMPYDVIIIAKDAGVITVQYTVQGARQNTPLLAAEEEAIKSMKDIKEVQEKLVNRETEPQAVDEPSAPIGDGIPF